MKKRTAFDPSSLEGRARRKRSFGRRRKVGNQGRGRSRTIEEEEERRLAAAAEEDKEIAVVVAEGKWRRKRKNRVVDRKGKKRKEWRKGGGGGLGSIEKGGALEMARTSRRESWLRVLVEFHFLKAHLIVGQ